MTPVALWFIFSVLLIVIAFIAILIPKFLIHLLKGFKLDGIFLGVLLISLITSLPEILTISLSPILDGESGHIQGFSNVLGSNLMTGFGFCLLDLYYFRLLTMRKITYKLKQTTFFVFLLNLFLFLMPFVDLPKINDFPIFNLLILVFYGLFTFWIFRKNSVYQDDHLEVDRSIIKFHSPRWVLSSIILALVFALITSMLFLFWCGQELKEIYQFDEKTMGGFFIAFATSSPEVWSAWSLFRLGFSHSAFGVIIGSHLFNIIFFLFFDIIFAKDLLSEINDQFILILGIILAINLIWLFIQNFSFGHFSLKYGIVPYSVLVLSLFCFQELIKVN